MFNVACIDSLKVRVKMDKIAIIDKRLLEPYWKFYPTIYSDKEIDCDDSQSFMDETFERSEPFQKIVNGITYRFYPKAFISSDKLSHEYMVFQLNAKMAKHKYFSGITLENLAQIVDDINSFGVLKITLANMLQGLWSDTDICINQLLDEQSLRNSIKTIDACLLNGKKPLCRPVDTESKVKMSNFGKDFTPLDEKEFNVVDPVFVTAPTAKTNLGYIFNSRDKANNSNPHMIIYHKGNELLTKSVDFYKAFLEPMQKAIIDNLVRFEYTIKNFKHKEYLTKKGLPTPGKTLKELLQADMKTLQAIAQSGLMQYIEPRTRPVVDQENTPMDMTLQYFIDLAIKGGASEDKIFGFADFIDSPVAKSRMKTKVKSLLTNITSKDEKQRAKLLENDKANEFLKNIGATLQ